MLDKITSTMFTLVFGFLTVGILISFLNRKQLLHVKNTSTTFLFGVVALIGFLLTKLGIPIIKYIMQVGTTVTDTTNTTAVTLFSKQNGAITVLVIALLACVSQIISVKNRRQNARNAQAPTQGEEVPKEDASDTSATGETDNSDW